MRVGGWFQSDSAGESGMGNTANQALDFDNPTYEQCPEISQTGHLCTRAMTTVLGEAMVKM